MDTRTGDIHSWDKVRFMSPEDRLHMKPMELPLTPRQERTRKVGRNEPCPCGSGHKFKKCCLLIPTPVEPASF